MEIRNLLAITTTDEQKNVYLLITNQNSLIPYTVDANLSALLNQASGVMWQFDKTHQDSLSGNPSLVHGNVMLTIPASGAILVKFSSR